MKSLRWLAVVLTTLVIVSGLVLAGPAPAALAQDDQPVVYGVLLYSPQCPHCHDFIQDEWPLMHEEFGDQFVLLFVNVLDENGRNLAMSAYEAYGIPGDQRYVPMMLIGEHVLVGGDQIPNEGREIIREGLANGGIDLPAIPGLREEYEAMVDQNEAANAPPAAEAEAAAAEQAAAEVEADTISARLARDPLANSLAITVLLGLIASVGVVLGAGSQSATWLEQGAGWSVALLVALGAFGIGITLIVRAGGDTLALLMAASVGLLMAVAVVAIIQGKAKQPGWLIPAVALAGLAAAVYLAVVELGSQEAVCGAVGDCNAVQQSPYATLFGVLPIGVLGIAGYVAILIAWAVGQFGSKQLADVGRAALLGLVLFGTVFSIYLTFLEPFVIGATCAWCLTSALVMLLLLWLTAPAGWKSLRRMRAR